MTFGHQEYSQTISHTAGRYILREGRHIPIVAEGWGVGVKLKRKSRKTNGPNQEILVNIDYSQNPLRLSMLR